ncbi:penicillin-binding protein activator [Ferrovibrio sp.]|uniref:penicillin-binding protein activator n=1 Tax=Ferrovibrio sp. TaxID=1917215 RepID=UPI003D0AE40B
MKSYLKAGFCALAMAALAACENPPTNLPELFDTIVSGRPTPVVRQQTPPPNQQPQGQQQGQRPPAQAQQPQPAPQPAPPASPSRGVEMQALPAVPPPGTVPGAPQAMTAPPPALVPPSAAEGVRIGFLVPLSGPSAALGRALLDAAQMALFDLGDDRLALLPRDTEGQPEAAVKAAQSLLAEGVDIIIGPLFASSAAAVAPLARERGVKVLSFSTDRGVAGSGVYILGFTPDQQVARVVGYARSRGMNRFALLAPDSAYGQAVSQAMEMAVAQPRGGQSEAARLLRQDRYPADAPDLTPTVRRFAAALRGLSMPEQPAGADGAPAPAAPLHGAAGALGQSTQPGAQSVVAAAPIDALLLPEGGARLRALAPLLPYFDIDPRAVRFMGTGLWDDPSLGNEPALIGGWFAGPPPEGFEEFRKRFEQSYGRRPPRLASLAYDATALAGVLSRNIGNGQGSENVGSGPGGLFADAVLNNPDGFAGYDGLFRFRADGVVERGLAVLEVQRRGMRVVDPAPPSFQVTAN